ncbi:DUF6069 family protein [Mesorhizobium japonicum]|uniref:DUF6069 family protein n=1 Tax=Mesorhizobium japonicum TaxID=2066070 RepID=UPI003B599171
MSVTNASDEPVRAGVLHLDLPLGRAQPRWWRWLIAAVVAGAASVGASAVLAVAGIAWIPGSASYEHFQPGDYVKLTLAGVAAGVVVWPLVTLLSTRAAGLYIALAVVATIVSFAPDLWILHLGQLPAEVLVLAIMHVAVAVVTVAALLLIAPQRRAR